ncbi:MAG: hypothetical protein B6D42_13995, partial [Anaerolineae bacterium UTCFX5]
SVGVEVAVRDGVTLGAVVTLGSGDGVVLDCGDAVALGRAVLVSVGRGVRDGTRAIAVVASVALGVSVGATVGVGCGMPMLAQDVNSSAHSTVASFRYTICPF